MASINIISLLKHFNRHKNILIDIKERYLELNDPFFGRGLMYFEERKTLSFNFTL